RVAEQLHHVGAEATNGTFFDGYEQFMFARQLQDELAIERFGKARIGDCYRNPMRCQRFRGLDAFGKTGAEGAQGDHVALHDDAALADFERYAGFRHRDADTIAARITQSAWSVINRDGSGDHVNKLGFVGRRHDYEVRKAAKISKIERSSMRRAV